MQTPTDVSVVPRDIHFSIEAARGTAWVGGNPVATAVFNALSLTFPDGERLFIDSVRKFRAQLSGKLAEDARAFIAQESIHSREHAALNRCLDREHYPVAWIESAIRKRIDFIRKLGPMRMLGVTIALEHFTAMLADMFDGDPELWDGTPEELLRLWRWHAMEETEHKAVAYDVFLEVTKGWSVSRRYWFRVRVMLLTSAHFTVNVIRYAAALLEADGVGRWAARRQVAWFLFGKPGLFRKLGPRYREWYRRRFHPWDYDNRAKLEEWRRQFA
ncbi:MAG: metal-dependent hydrolase [Gammaproteobacteria bacterium]|nr:metal-dependent hydrolase [Gammaproteobacteria bacterium]